VGEEAVLSFPCVLGREGVIRRLPLALDHQEQQMLTRSAAVLEAAYRDNSRSIIHDDRPGAVNGRPRISPGRTDALMLDLTRSNITEPLDRDALIDTLADAIANPSAGRATLPYRTDAIVLERAAALGRPGCPGPPHPRETNSSQR
jgi:hypothetical protein